MSEAIRRLHSFLAKSPSVVYPEDILAYLPAIESENADLRELASKCMSALRRNGISLAEYEVLEGMCYALGVEYE